MCCPICTTTGFWWRRTKLTVTWSPLPQLAIASAQTTTVARRFGTGAGVGRSKRTVPLIHNTLIVRTGRGSITAHPGFRRRCQRLARRFADRDLDARRRAVPESATLDLHARPVKADHLADRAVLRGCGEHRPFVPDRIPPVSSYSAISASPVSSSQTVHVDTPPPGVEPVSCFSRRIRRMMTRRQQLDVNAEVTRRGSVRRPTVSARFGLLAWSAWTARVPTP